MTRLIIKPKNRTDICGICNAAELILMKMKKERKTLIQMTEIEQEYIRLFRIHYYEAASQRSSMHEAIFNLKPCQAVIIADFKENFQAEYKRDQESQEFFKKHPVTCLSFEVHIMSAKQQHIKVVYTILSKCLTHIAQFVIRALRRIFREPEFRGLTALHWWSDGAGHFRNTALLDVLLEKRKGKQMLLNCEINVSYFCAAHGKSECDSCFGYFSRLLNQSTPVDGINSLQDLSFRFMSQCITVSPPPSLCLDALFTSWYKAP
ncbi:MAG: hypothetical protein EZS28_042449 [Streblomastix strix]|uniref:Uncharacterized protein n=1 Tax=Streblomastix strix TaxID=222440 RepID=A0A5J4TXA0_9EUKA|nr:MAG: hypothetical protein EZS28_042449 [Streblomastix strix]